MPWEAFFLDLICKLRLEEKKALFTYITTCQD